MSHRYHQEGYERLVTNYGNLLNHLRQDRKGGSSVLSRWLVGRTGELLPALEPVWLSIERTELQQCAVEAEIVGLSEHYGWLRRRSGLYMTVAGGAGLPTGSLEKHGPLLSGEWSLGRDRSVALSFEGGRWVKRDVIEARNALADFDEGIANRIAMPALAQTVTTTAIDGWLMLYRVYWGAEAEAQAPGGWPTSVRRIAARFAGFRRAEEDRT